MRNFEDLLRELVEVAEYHETLDRTTGSVSAILEDADVAWAVFNDAAEGKKFGTLIIKGAALIEEAALGRSSGALRCTAIKTVDLAMAIAAREIFGDGGASALISDAEIPL